MLREAHPGYVTWEQFLQNQQRLDDNRTFRPEDGAVPCEKAPRCSRGSCSADSVVDAWGCATSRMARRPATTVRSMYGGRVATCQSIRGDGVDAAVAAPSWKPCNPPSWRSRSRPWSRWRQADQIERQWQLRLERAQYEADLGPASLPSVEPENRLVARTWSGIGMTNWRHCRTRTRVCGTPQTQSA